MKLNSLLCRTIISPDTFIQRGNRPRESLPTFITLHKARAVYHWEVVADTKLFQDSSLVNSVCNITLTDFRLKCFKIMASKSEFL